MVNKSLVYIDLSGIKPYGRNPRKNIKAISAVEDSLKRYVNFTKNTKIKLNGKEIEWPINKENTKKYC